MTISKAQELRSREEKEKNVTPSHPLPPSTSSAHERGHFQTWLENCLQTMTHWVIFLLFFRRPYRYLIG